MKRAPLACRRGKSIREHMERERATDEEESHRRRREPPTKKRATDEEETASTVFMFCSDFDLCY